MPLHNADQTAEKPTLTIYLPEKENNTGAAVVIFPGGGYWNLAMDHEGHQIAGWLNSFGVTGIIVKYRRGTGSEHPVPLTDAQRAIRTVRFRAKNWGIQPDKIGVMGFSAGGHLASTTGTHFDPGQTETNDPVDSMSCRPDFMILVYPVITMDDEFTHSGSKRNLLGENPDPQLVTLMSNEKQITSDTPPTFLILSNSDSAVPAENSVLFYISLRKAGVPAEMHIFENGKHGFGLAFDDPYLSEWPKLCQNWLTAHDFLKK
ncbi:alpha/beta hydrolase [candidate division KSB1 bacterium]|nr:alpha/beta hydrolase [candidate division KSB1 bacterium]